MSGGVDVESLQIRIVTEFGAAGGSAIVTFQDVLIEEFEFFLGGGVEGVRSDMTYGVAPREASDGGEPSIPEVSVLSPEGLAESVWL